MKDPVLLQAFQSWQELSSTKEQIVQYESRLKHLLDEEAAVKEAELRVQEALEKGLEEGREEGREERDIEIAQKMILERFDNDVIAKLTNLSISQIEQLRRELH